MSGLTVRYVEVEGFRLFRNRVRFSLVDGLNILHGPIGSGKSSVIQAIEFALYGSQLELRERVSKLSDLINEQSNETYVEVGLGDFKIARRLFRKGSSASQLLYLDGKEAADDEVLRIVGIDDYGFERVILVTHRTLEDLIYGPARGRTIAVDRLFGLDFLEALIGSLPVRQVEEAIEDRKKRLAGIREVEDLVKRYGSIKGAYARRDELARLIDDVRARIKDLTAAYVELANRRSKLLEQVKAHEEQYLRYLQVKERLNQLNAELQGVKPEEYSEVLVRGVLEVVRRMLIPRLELVLLHQEAEALEAARGIGEMFEATYRAVKALESRLSNLREEAESLRRSRDDLNRLIEGIRAEIDAELSRVRVLEQAARQYLNYVKQYGELSKVRAEYERAKAEYEALSRDVRFKASLMEVLRGIIEEVEAKGSAKCPICGAEITRDRLNELRDRVEELAKELGGSGILDLRSRLIELEATLASMEASYNQYVQYVEAQRRVEEYRRQLNEYLDKVQRLDSAIKDLERKIKDIGDTLEIARKRLEEAESKYNVLRKIAERDRLAEEAKRLEEELKPMNLNLEEAVRIDEAFRDVEAKLNNLKKALEEYTSEYMQLDLALSKLSQAPIDVEALLSEVKELEGYRDLFKRIIDKALSLQYRLRGEVAGRIAGAFNEVFKEVYPYSDIEGVSFRLSQRRGMGSDYVMNAVRGGREVPISRLSDGQRLIMAQAFVLAAYRFVKHNLSFMLLDEPIPYVDVRVKEMFSRALAKAVSSNLVRQVIVATQDEQMVNMLTKAFSEVGIAVNLIKLPIAQQHSTP